jgi:hypothetical protein
MIDGFLNTLKKTGERVQRRGEEVAQAARLRVDLFQLNRELDALYARLGRAYHGQASVSTLEEIRAEIGRVDEEIAASERLLSELGSQPEVSADGPASAETAPVTLAKAGTGDRADSPLTVTAESAPSGVSTSQAQPVAQTVLSVWREKEATRMSDSESTSQKITGPTTDITGRPDSPDADPTRTTGENSGGNPTIPNSDKREVLGDKTASMGKEAARDEMTRRQNHLEEGKRATQDPDPLASKD